MKEIIYFIGMALITLYTINRLYDSSIKNIICLFISAAIIHICGKAMEIIDVIRDDKQFTIVIIFVVYTFVLNLIISLFYTKKEEEKNEE